ncbi:unnamed protein product [Dovyalis caffra]|uniref:Non-haem dioxygenase N-terminal domain-containing protein n=1 Tax=Dovyalis caffra TaxID=77055 RepID=A0AAV1SIQ6_9ROSI|nr:unnamed protein product [Dovyalis caffra]
MEAATLGTSLPVPCVRELAKESLTTVPTRYLRDPPIISDIAAASSPQIPVIDMQRLISEEFMDLELDKLDHACKEWVGEVNDSLVNKVNVEIQELFDLPMEEKTKYWQTAGEMEGFGQAFVVSKEQKLDWGDIFYMVTLPTHERKPHLFPKLPPPLRDTLEAYSAELKNLAIKILYLMATALRMKPDTIG